MNRIPSSFKIHSNVAQALSSSSPVVALESTVITHGLPRPQNLELALAMEAQVKKHGAVPATVALMNGTIRVGMEMDELQLLASAEVVHKISTRDLSIAVACGWTGGTTVSGTMFAAHKTGIKIFATGGIGGVHRGNPLDVSADLDALACIPIVVVCSGAKAILDLPATREKLETLGVPVIGFQTSEFPAFYSARSGLSVDFSAGSEQEIANIARNHWKLGLQSALLVVNPPPPEYDLPVEQVESAVNQALQNAQKAGITGSAVTPFLLSQMKDLSAGKSLETNLALLQSNARLAAGIASSL